MNYQMQLTDEIIVDNFAGGGGASCGIEAATGKPINIAVNHDPEAIAMHQMNHPHTQHFCENVWDIDPVKVCAGRRVGLAWFSPDCKHFSKAKGGKPVEKKIRGLAWVVLRWAATVKPRIICLENVEEFTTWGPILDGKPCPKNKGKTFRSFVTALKAHGYEVEWRSLRACDYGAPTIRKRLVMIARCDGLPIVWPCPTHGPKNSGLLPYKTAADCIDWSLTGQSIFNRKKPLAEATMARVAKGVKKFVIDSKQPFIVTCNHSGDSFRGQGIDEPMKTITASRDAHGIVQPYIIPIGYGEAPGQAPRCNSIDSPLGTIVAGGIKHAVVAPFLTECANSSNQRNMPIDEPLRTQCAEVKGGHFALIQAGMISPMYSGADGRDPRKPLGTVTTIDHNAAVSVFMTKMRGTNIGSKIDDPLHTISAGGQHHAEVRAFLVKYYGNEKGTHGIDSPIGAVTTKDRFGLVTLRGQKYQISDIYLRMLTPAELYAAQGFPKSYIFDRAVVDGSLKTLSKRAQVKMCGNSVSPPMAEAVVRANYTEQWILERKEIA